MANDNLEKENTELNNLIRNEKYGRYFERAMLKMREVLKDKGNRLDIEKMAQEIYSDLCHARKGLDIDSEALNPFFDMFHGLFASVDEKNLDPDYEYEEQEGSDKGNATSFELYAAIPVKEYEEVFSRIKDKITTFYPEYRLALEDMGMQGIETLQRPGSYEEYPETEFHLKIDEEEAGFFITDGDSNLVGVSFSHDTMSSEDTLLQSENSPEPLSEEAQDYLNQATYGMIEVIIPPQLFSEEEKNHYYTLALLLVRTTRCILECMEDHAIVFVNSRIYEKDEYIAMVEDLDADDFLPVDLFAYAAVNDYEDGQSSSIITYGLSSLGMVDMICHTGNDEVEKEEMLLAVQDLVNYIVQEEVEIEDGSVISYDGRTKFLFTLDREAPVPLFVVKKVRGRTEKAFLTLKSQYHGNITYNRYNGLARPLSFFRDGKRNTVLFHVPASEVEYTSLADNYSYLLDNLSFIFEGIRDYMVSEDMKSNEGIRKLLRKEKVGKGKEDEFFTSLKPTDVYLCPTLDGLEENNALMKIRYRKACNSKHYIDLLIDQEVKLTGLDVNFEG